MEEQHVPALDEKGEEQEYYFFPLSFMQESLWALNHMHGEEATAYHLFSAMHLAGPLHFQALYRALTTIVERHEILRTAFLLVGQQPMQAIVPRLSFPLPVIDISGFSLAEQRQALQNLSQALTRYPLVLDVAPLFRVFLIDASADEHILLFVFHHIIADGPSFQLLHDELMECYTAYIEEREPRVAELPVQYADYAVWQRERFQGEEEQSAVSYWREQLRGLPALLELPTDYPRPSVQMHEGATWSFYLPEQLSEQLQILCRRTGSTLFMVLLSGFMLLLSYYSGQTDIVVGSPVSHRTRQEFANLIGPLLNTLLLRVDLAQDPTFLQLLERVRSVCVDAYSHQEMPFEYLVELMQPERSLSYNPLFQIFFAFHNYIEGHFPTSQLFQHEAKAMQTMARFDLSCDIVQREQSLLCTLEYDTGLFTEETVMRMGRHLQNLLQHMVSNPQQRISQLPLFDPQEYRTLVTTWNACDALYPQTSCLHELFAAQAARVPQKVAVSCDGRILTYQTLNERAEQVADYLLQHGVGTEALVGLFCTRSEDYVIAALGVLKAGCAYVPLDPEYPVERLRFIVQDAHLQAILVSVDGAAYEPLEFAGPVIPLTAVWEWQQPTADKACERCCFPENLAYVLYTSGSTGRPKGIQISHRAVVNFLTSMQRQPGFSEQDCLLAVTSFSFDIAGLEIFLPLLSGGRVELATREMTLDSHLLTRALKQSGATVMQATPVTWRMLLLADEIRLDGLKALCGGEALSRKLAESLLNRGADLWNMYGPTETTIWSLLLHVQQPLHARSVISIGAPIANTQVYILDTADHLLPAGIPGELVIGGDGLARGYLRRSDLTAERFVPDPFCQRPGARLYRTGDRARWLYDGTLEFLGRLDMQVKLRGFRIELGEIESLLVQHPAIRDAVVLVRDYPPDQQRLVAYVIAQGGHPNEEAFRAHLRKYLPEYMIPAIFACMTAFPLTPNGKLDRKALPIPPANRGWHEKAIRLPQTELEQQLAAIWSEVLGQSQIGLDDNFFALGGDSIQAVQVCTRARSLRIDLTPQHLFRYQTIGTICQKMEQSREPVGGANDDARVADTVAPILVESAHQPVTSQGQATTEAYAAADRAAVAFPKNKLNKIMAQVQKGKKRL